MDTKTIVLPTARAIRHEQLLDDSKTLFLPNHITMHEFISKLCIVKGFKIIDDDSRVLLLLEACDFSSFSNLKIERNFFTFMKNSSYIFKFFEELSAEQYDIQKLESSDIYAEYEEHIAILRELYKRYEHLCSSRKILDKIFLPKLYSFNKSYALTHKKIELHLDGHLTNFEFTLLERCCEYASVEIIFTSSKFNVKMQKKFLELGIELDAGYLYKISLNSKEIISKTMIEHKQNIHCESFSESVLQVAFVKRKVYEYMKKGYEAEKIALILPDEKFANKLRCFDEKYNFNFAMGESFSKTNIYKMIDASCVAIEQASQENSARLKRVGDEIYKRLFGIYYKKVEEVDVDGLLNDFLQMCKTNKEEKKIYKEEVYSLRNLLISMKDMSIKSFMSLFLQRVASRSLDDICGGKITVMGVLETRSISFDAVIIVDFSDANVPKRSDKDMFLNTQIREIANLPTMSDRENLQKHYYEMLINSSKEVCISYVESEQSSGSRFLKYLGIASKPNEEKEYAKILFEKKKQNFYEEPSIIREYSFKNVKLSATMLKTFLTCKRKYFYSYVQSIKTHEIPRDMPHEWEIGTAVHDALNMLYSKKSSYTDAKELKKDIDKELDAVCGKSELDRYLIDMQKTKMFEFANKEVARFREGYRVKYCEKNLTCNFEGMSLNGFVDRVDAKDNELFVLDYKTGNYPIYNAKNFTEAKDFQLEFYYLLASTLGNVSFCGYYDLKENKIVTEAFLEEKLDILKSHIKDLQNIQELNFEKCEDIKSCQFCDFKIVCDRE
ncbi:MAG: PD-(D/E)XK nuclease family protein [Sulfurimonas sp.]|nr:PD-(D/E)XK nuclease family protein [Sulfurimonas sp.]